MISTKKSRAPQPGFKYENLNHPKEI